MECEIERVVIVYPCFAEGTLPIALCPPISSLSAVFEAAGCCKGSSRSMLEVSRRLESTEWASKVLKVMEV